MNFNGMDNNSNEFGHWNRSSEDILKQRYPLHKFCRDGDIESLSLLLISGQQSALLEDEFYGWTPAHWAAYFGKLACLRRIMQVLSTEPMTSRYQQTPAHLAAYSGHPHCLQWLLRTGSDLQRKDYLGETPAHKAARTGSMECLSLMAAEHSDLNIESNVGMSPSQLAAKCGYADSALYLDRAAKQQRLKLSGVIDDVVLPILQTQPVLPGQRPDRCIITQGINGGRLPNSIDSQCIPKANQGMDVDMELNTSNDNGLNTSDYGFGDHHHNGLGNGFSDHQNGFGDHHHNGFQNGFTHKTNGYHGNGLQKDVLLSHDVSSNRAGIAGRKRCREVIEDDENEEWKRVRRLETGQGQWNDLPSNSPALENSSFGEPVEQMNDEPMDNAVAAPQSQPAGYGNVEISSKQGRSMIFDRHYMCSHRYCLKTVQAPCFVQQLAASSSIDEHRSYLLAQQGYDSMMFETMLLESHGS